MAAEVGSIYVALKANAADLQKGMLIASASVDKFDKASRADLDRFDRRFVATSTLVREQSRLAAAGIATFSKGLLLSIAPALSFTAAIAGAKAAVDKFSTINDLSGRARLDSEFFQGLAHEAKLAGVQVDAVATAAENFARVSAQAIEGRGKLFSALKAEHAPLLESIQLATTQEQRWRLIADAIRDAKSADDALVIATAAFGEQGTKLVGVLKDGGAEIDRMVAKAKELGIIVDRDVIARADELGDQLDTVSTIVENQLKTAFVNLGPVLVGLTGYFADWTGDLNIVLDQLKEIDQRTSLKPLQNNLVAIENQRGQLLQEIGGLEDQLKSLDPTSGIAGDVTAEIKQKAEQAEQLMRQALEYQERIAELQGKPKNNLSAPTTTNPLSPVLVPERGVGSDGREAPRHEAGESLGTVSAGLIKVAKTSHDATYAVATTSDAVTKLTERWKTAEDLAQSFGSTFLDDMQSGKTFVESLSDAFGDLAHQLEQMALNKAISSLFDMLSGGLTSGGPKLYSGSAFSGGWGSSGLSGGKSLFGGTIIPGILHQGGRAGADGYNHGRSFSPATWMGAPQFHEGVAALGLRGDEIPAILQKGETVLPAGSSIGGGVHQTINITVEGSSGNAQADDAYLAKLRTSIRTEMEQVALRTIDRQLRIGGRLNGIT